MKVGDTTKKVFVLYVQKTDGIVKNAVVKLNHSLVSYIQAHPERFGDVEYINMMDDAGQESLRRMKKDYSPDETLGKSYRAYLAQMRSSPRNQDSSPSPSARFTSDSLSRLMGTLVLAGSLRMRGTFDRPRAAVPEGARG